MVCQNGDSPEENKRVIHKGLLFSSGIVAGEAIMGIVIAHLLATRMFGSTGDATRSQIFLAVLMVSYTVFGLWLLSTASIG